MRAYIGQTPISEIALGNSVVKNTILPYFALQRFIELTGISGSEATAITNLYDSLISNGLLNEMVALYPFVGGTASAHSYNLINPELYQIAWSGGVTHNANGITGNGTNGYGDTGLFTQNWTNPLNSFGISVYARTGGASKYDVGSITIGNKQRVMICRYLNNFNIFSDGSDPSLGIASTDGSGFYTGVSQGLSTGYRALYRNSTLSVSDLNGAPTSLYLDRGAFYILAANQHLAGGSPGAIEFSNRNLALVAFHNYLDSTQSTNFYNIVQTYQTALGRAV